MMTSSSETTLVAAIRELAMELRLLRGNLSFFREIDGSGADSGGTRAEGEGSHGSCEKQTGFPVEKAIDAMAAAWEKTIVRASPGEPPKRG